MLLALVLLGAGCSGDDDGGTTSTAGDGDLSPAAAAGRKALDDQGCTSCHTTDGGEGIGPTLAGLYGSTVELEDGTEVTADEEYLTRSIEDPGADVVAGYNDIMPVRRVPGDQVADIVEYLRALGDQG